MEESEVGEGVADGWGRGVNKRLVAYRGADRFPIYLLW